VERILRPAGREMKRGEAKRNEIKRNETKGKERKKEVTLGREITRQTRRFVIRIVLE
jgi:hypothetical protein